MADLSHLVERAAERLRASGALDPATAALLAASPKTANAPASGAEAAAPVDAAPVDAASVPPMTEPVPPARAPAAPASPLAAGQTEPDDTHPARRVSPIEAFAATLTAGSTERAGPIIEAVPIAVEPALTGALAPPIPTPPIATPPVADPSPTPPPAPPPPTGIATGTGTVIAAAISTETETTIEPATQTASPTVADRPQARSRLFRPRPVATPGSANVLRPAGPDSIQIKLDGDGSARLNGRAMSVAGGDRMRVDLSTMQLAGMVDWTRTRSRLSEELRLVQSQILRTAFSPEPGQRGPGHGNLVMVTSARPGEGKSFSALNLAASIARQRDREVLLIDVDSKPGSLGQRLRLETVPGLLDLTLNPALDASRLLVATEFDKLSILPIGQPIERSAELFSTRQMSRTIRDLGKRFADRIVILDAAPILSTSDPSMLAPIVGQILMVVEAERTQRAEVEAALDLIQACPTILMLLNKVQAVQRHGFGGYASGYPY